MSIERVPTAGTSSQAAVISSAATAVTEELSKEPGFQTVSASPVRDDLNVGHPREQFEVGEEGTTGDDDVVYPTGAKLWLTYTSVLIAMFLNGLDIAIVAPTGPRLTDQFKTIADIGWYSAAYGMVASSFIFFFGKCYTVFRAKQVYIFGLTVFELGSLLCTFAPTSKAFILGRAVAGFGASAFGGGLLKLLKDMFPLNKQALMIGIAGGAQCIGLVSAPILGGALIDAFSWRACFGINLPLGVMCIAFTAWAFTEPIVLPDTNLPLKEKVKRLDLVSTVLVVPAISSLLMALQWGGVKYGWNDGRIIGLFVVFGVLFSGFGYLQFRLGEKACVPPRILKKRSILGAMLYNSCCNGILATTEYYISVYFQGVRGYTATKAGLLGVPMLVGLFAASMLSASGTTIIGYNYPFLYATSILTPIASGLLTTIDLDGSVVKAAVLLGCVGAAVGLGCQGPPLAVQAALSSKDVPIGSAMTFFAGGLGSAIWVTVSATLFQNRLNDEILRYSPSTNITAVEVAGLSEIRHVIGQDRLRNVLTGYNKAVVQTLYMPVGLAILTIVGSIAIERFNMKKKQA